MVVVAIPYRLLTPEEKMACEKRTCSSCDNEFASDDFLGTIIVHSSGGPKPVDIDRHINVRVCSTCIQKIRARGFSLEIVSLPKLDAAMKKPSIVSLPSESTVIVKVEPKLKKMLRW
jgi:hypothetical protein